jgi:uncharacterized RDD family membrane protein YckC
MIDPSLRVGFLLRVGAVLLDVVILLPFIGAAIGASYYLESQGKLTPEIEYALGVALSIGALAYHTLDIFTAATPGKMLLGQRIVAVDGSTAPVGTLVSRFLVKNFAGLFGLVAAITALDVLDRLLRLVNVATLIAFLPVLGAARQAVWDQLAGTIVMRKKDLQEIPGFQPLVATSSPPPPV